MDSREGFAAEIRANPGDVVPRLVYADFLEESGDPQGEFVRVQCELAGTSVTGQPPARLREREAELLEAYGETWLGRLRDLGAEGVDTRCFRLGLAERVRIPADRVPDVVDQLCEAEPALHCLEVRGADRGINELVAATLPPQIVEVELASNGLLAEYVPEFLRAPWRETIRVLNLGFNRLGDAGIAALTDQEWPELQRLVLDSTRLGPEGVRAIATWPTMSHVESLSLNLNAVGAGATWLGRSVVLNELRRLALASNRIDQGGAEAFAGAAWFGSIEELVLRHNPLGSAGLRALANSTGGGRLTSFDVRNTTTRVHGEVDDVPAELRRRFGDALIADAPRAEAGT